MSKKTIIVFSGDYDKVMAAFIIANGAAAMDDEVTMFFTFWGLATLRKPSTGAKATGKPKSTLQKGFSMMLPPQPGEARVVEVQLRRARPDDDEEGHEVRERDDDLGADRHAPRSRASR